jgi:eukaryotic-like serine/threonine-protein kinase
LNPSTGQRAYELFCQVIELPAEERLAAAVRLCGDDAALAAEVTRLVAASLNLGGFLDNPTQWGVRREESAEPTPQSIGGYTVVSQIGEGGFGRVFLAWQRQPRRLVAVKLLKERMQGPLGSASFVSEMNALASMDHPHIARVIEAGATDDGRPFMALELVHGQPITLFARQYGLATADRLRLMVQVCAAMQHAHDRRVLHRDLKPSNILVAFQDGAPSAKVIDFGIAKSSSGMDVSGAMDGGSLQDSCIAGTPKYMSPEQKSGGSTVGPQADVYALGVILHELIVDRSTSARDTAEPTGTRRAAADGPGARSGLTGELLWVYQRAVEPNVERRYESAGALGADLKCLIEDRPVKAAPAPRVYRAKKFMLRRRWALATVAAVLAFGSMLVVAVNRSEGELGTAMRLAKARRLALLSEGAGVQQPQLRALLALRAAESLPTTEREQVPEFVQALVRAVEGLGGQPMAGHSAALTAAQFSPVGDLALTASMDGTVRVWDIHRGEAPRCVDVLGERTGPVRCAAFTPNGRGVVAGYDDGTVRAWTLGVAGAHAVARVLGRHDGAVNSVECSPSGAHVVSASADGSARVWSALATKESPACAVLLGHRGDVRTAKFDASERFVVTASYDSTVMVWDLSSAAPEGREVTCNPGGGWARSAIFSPTNEFIAVACVPPRVVSARTGAEVAALVVSDADKEGAVTLACSPDGALLATGGADGVARIWQGHRDGTWGLQRELMGHAGSVRSVAFLPDGQSLVTAGEDGTVRVWSLGGADPGECRLVLRGHDRAVVSAVSAPDGVHVLSASKDGTARLWDLDSCNPEGGVWECATSERRALHCIAVHPASRTVAVGGEGALLSVWSPWQVPHQPDPVPLNRHARGVRSVAIDPAGAFVLTAGQEPDVAVWDRARQVSVCELKGEESDVLDAEFSLDGRYMLLLSAEGMVRVRRVEGVAAREVVCEFGTSGVKLQSARFGNVRHDMIVTSGEDGVARVWRWSESGVVELEYELPTDGGWLLDARFSPDDSHVLTAGADGRARLWRLESGRSASQTAVLNGHRGWVIACAFSSDGKRALTGGLDDVVCEWLLADGVSDPTPVMLRSRPGLTAVAYGPGAREIIAVTRGGLIRRWDLDCEALCAQAKDLVGRDLTEEEWLQVQR